MTIFSKESLETLRQKIDLVEVLSSHLELKKTGASYKALCPFHDEKSPSFTVQKGDTHYHCYGCGAHGDAIQFLISHLNLSFHDAIENLAQRFHVHLEKVEGEEEEKGPSKADLKNALEEASRYFHFMLLHTPEGHEALHYLYSRNIDLNFIRQFRVGFAPKAPQLFRKTMHAKFIKDEILDAAGLISPNQKGGWHDFFSDRITFPIRDATGYVIGFSARKFKEDTFGGKYVNTPETSIFKKSRVLFGLNFSRKRIAKERKVIIVEGQIDALRLIQEGFNYTVAGQGTAFGEGHLKELMHLGVNEVFLALDSDHAGQEATRKIGDLCQKEGIEVRIVQLPSGQDPDSFIRKHGKEAFIKLLENSSDYLTFLVKHYSKQFNTNSPAGKNELIQTIVKQIRTWDQPVMVHESLRKLAHLTQVSEEMVGVGQNPSPNLYLKRSANIGLQTIDPDRILESDFLRWLLLMGTAQPHFVEIAKANITPIDLRSPLCQQIYEYYLEKGPSDLLTLAIQVLHPEAQQFISEILQKKVNKERAETHFVETIQKILDRNWMQKREEIKMRIQSGQASDDEVLELVKQFDAIKQSPPQVSHRIVK
jgi:DNA primase